MRARLRREAEREAQREVQCEASAQCIKWHEASACTILRATASFAHVAPRARVSPSPGMPAARGDEEKATQPRGGTANCATPPVIISSTHLSEVSASTQQSQQQADDVQRATSDGSVDRHLFQRTRPPRYRSLPATLLWPNPEVLVCLVFSTGLVEAASAVLGAFGASASVPKWATGLACASLLAWLIFIGLQARKLAVFHLSHADKCWMPIKKPVMLYTHAQRHHFPSLA